MNYKSLLFLLLLTSFCIISCDDKEEDPEIEVILHKAYEKFDSDNFTIMLDGSDVVIESNGYPNHESPYWSSTNARMGTPAVAENHPLFSEPETTTFEMMAPGNIDDFNGSFTLTVPANPERASSSSATGLGPIGFAISGGMIYNDQEGPNVPLDNAIGSLDKNGAHTGPQSYHYHLEPISFSDDDSNLVGIISDGFFIYGRKCFSTNDYPTDLDESGGHTSITIDSEGEEEYHYHIQNTPYLGQYYILFPGNYQGTPNDIN